MRQIDAELPADDGVAVFNRMYLRVTETIAADMAQSGTATPPFRDTATMGQLDVRFAGLWLTAHDADAGHRAVATAWAPLFEARRAGRYPVQYAVAGMNSHIEHDLPVAVVETCQAAGLEPADIRADYEAVNDALARIETPIRRSFLDQAGRDLDNRVGPVVHALSTWDIDSAREVAWVTAETLWTLRASDLLRARFLDALARTVAMTSWALLTPSG
jgi:hypothetical protein